VHDSSAARVARPLRVLTYTAPGAVIPHTLDDIRQALLELGHRVFVQDLAGLSARARDAHALDVALIDGLVRTAPDVVLTIDAVGLVPAYLAMLEPCPRIVSWFYDDPIQVLDAKRMDFARIAGVYDIFCWDRSYLSALRARGLHRVHYMPFATSPHVFRPRPVEPVRYDISFVGHCTETRIRHVRALADAGLSVDVFGDAAWRALAHPRVRHHGPADSRSACPRIYAASRINLNVTSAQLRTSLPVRVFDVLGCEGFLLTDVREDTRALFAPGLELATYTGLEELVLRARYFLARPAARAAIARAGAARVHREHTFRARMTEMLARLAGAPCVAPDRDAPGDDLLVARWLAGLAYLKAGALPLARVRLAAACTELPDDARLRDAWTALRVAACNADGLRRVDWCRLYAGLLGDALAPDGTVPGASPIELRRDADARASL
jgi:hypothetical protein